MPRGNHARRDVYCMIALSPVSYISRVISHKMCTFSSLFSYVTLITPHYIHCNNNYLGVWCGFALMFLPPALVLHISPLFAYQVHCKHFELIKVNQSWSRLINVNRAISVLINVHTPMHITIESLMHLDQPWLTSGLTSINIDAVWCSSMDQRNRLTSILRLINVDWC